MRNCILFKCLLRMICFPVNNVLQNTILCSNFCCFLFLLILITCWIRRIKRYGDLKKIRVINWPWYTHKQCDLVWSEIIVHKDTNTACSLLYVSLKISQSEHKIVVRKLGCIGGEGQLANCIMEIKIQLKANNGF